jgi:thiol-disulfide isomerase/thioredoxin
MKLYATLLSCFLASLVFAQAPNGYEIKVTLKPFKNQYIYLGHYYGKQLPIVDSVLLNDKSEATFKGPNKLGGGIYLIGYPDRSHNFELLIDKNQKFSVVADTANINKRSFQNSPENTAFMAYQDFMMNYGSQLDVMYKQRSGASETDSLKITALIKSTNETVKKYRNDLIAKDPDGILAVLLKAMKEPEVPQNRPGGDSLFAYHYYKNHYWDGVNFYDERLARTPFFEGRVDKYFEQLVYPVADSVIKEIDNMMAFASINEEMQKFLLLKFANRYLNQKYMWEDAVFVHLYEKYFSQKNYSWMNEKGKKVITDRAYSLMANLTGKPAANIELPDPEGKTISLYDVNAPYILLTIWDPTCGHCKETLPKLDSLYNAKWKAQGIKMFGMAKETEGKKEDWLKFISEYKLQNWVHVYYSKEAEKKRVDAGIPGYSQLFDVQSFPTLYLLDKNKNIIAKKLSESQVEEILEHWKKNGK